MVDNTAGLPRRRTGSGADQLGFKFWLNHQPVLWSCPSFCIYKVKIVSPTSQTRWENKVNETIYENTRNPRHTPNK